MTYGTLVHIGNSDINVYTEGTGNITLVFMAGSGVTSPVLEYKILYSRLSDEYKIAIVEKPGYGLSGKMVSERTVENMVNESRAALKAVGIDSNYILIPHSYSGLEAIWWANNYPNEVKAVFSIDMVVTDMALAQAKEIPESKKMKMIEQQKKLYKIVCKRGILSKLFKKRLENASGLLTANVFTNEEKELYIELFYKNLLNEEVFEESFHATENAIKVQETGNLKVPAYFYISDMKTPVKSISWSDASVNYAKNINAEFVLTNAGHMMYAKIPDEISSALKRFVKSLDS